MMGGCRVIQVVPGKIEVKNAEKALNRVCIALSLACIVISIFALCTVLIACV